MEKEGKPLKTSPFLGRSAAAAGSQGASHGAPEGHVAAGGNGDVLDINGIFLLGFSWDFHGILGFSWDFKRILMCFFSSGFEWQSRGGGMILPQMRGLGAEQIVTDPVKVH